MSKVRMALIFSSASLYGYQLLNLFFAIYIARMLTPSELGIYAIAASITMVSGELKILGTGDYLIRQKVISAEIVKASLGLSILVSWSIGIVLIIASSLIAEYYDYKVLKSLLLILSLSFFFSPFIAINGALLRKEMNYKRSMIIGWSSTITNFSLSILLIINGFSYYSLAIGVSFGIFIELLMSYLLRSENMQYWPSLKNVKPIVAFGTVTTLANVCKRLSKLSYDLILGKIGTAHHLAIFSRGAGFIDFLTHLVTGSLKSVALPYLAEANTDPVNLKSAYQKATLLATSLLIPILTVAAISGNSIIVLLFGEQWQESGSLTTNLAIWLALSNLQPFAKEILIARKLEREYFLLELGNLLIISAFIITGFQYGLATIAQLFIVAGGLYFIATSFLVNKAIDFSIYEFLKVFYKNSLLTIVCGISAYFLTHVIMDEYSNAIKILSLSMIMPIIWLLTVIKLKLEILDEIHNLLKLLSVFNKKQSNR